jgi:hypothetical protein
LTSANDWKVGQYAVTWVSNVASSQERVITANRYLSGPIGSSALQPYYYDAIAGEHASIRVSSAGGALDPGLILQAPDGKLLSFGGSDIEFQCTAVAIPRTGRYLIVFFDASSIDKTGEFGACVVSDRLTSSSDDLGTAAQRNGTIKVGEMHPYYFSAGRGERVNATMSLTGGALDPQLTLIDSEGKVLAANASDTRAVIQHTLPYTGRYMLISADGSLYSKNGDYSFNFKIDPGSQPVLRNTIAGNHLEISWITPKSGTDELQTRSNISSGEWRTLSSVKGDGALIKFEVPMTDWEAVFRVIRR